MLVRKFSCADMDVNYIETLFDYPNTIGVLYPGTSILLLLQEISSCMLKLSTMCPLWGFLTFGWRGSGIWGVCCVFLSGFLTLKLDNSLNPNQKRVRGANKQRVQKFAYMII